MNRRSEPQEPRRGDRAPGLRRHLGFWALVAYGVGDILGAGIYALVGKVAAVAGTEAWCAFGVAMGVASLTALSYAELGARLPTSGGEASFAQHAFGRRRVAFLVGWLVFSSGLVSLATVARAFAGYVLEPLAVVSAPTSWLVSALFLVLLCGVAFWGIRQSSTVNIVCTVVEVGGLLIVIATGLSFILRAGTTEPPTLDAPDATLAGGTWLVVAQGAALAFFAFIGFEDMVNVAEEIKEPERNLPVAVLLAVAVAGSVYILVAWVATSVVPARELGVSEAPLLEVVRRTAPWFPPWLFTVIALFAVANTALLNSIMASRLLYGMARQRLLPSTLGVVHPQTRTPHRAILAILLVALALLASGSLTALAGATSSLLLLVFFAVNVSLIVLKRRADTTPPQFRVPLAVPLVAAATCLLLTVFAPPESLLLAVALVVLGVGLAFAGPRADSSENAWPS